MTDHLSHPSAVASPPEDVDPELLRHTQDYLECRSSRAAPPRASRAAWEEFYRLYDPVIRRFALVHGASGADLNDCVQEVWTTLLAKLSDFRYDPGRGLFLSWLYTLVGSKATDLIRQKTRHPAGRLSRAAAARLRGPDADPAAEYERRRQQALVRGVLGELRGRAPECSYRVLYLRWIEGRTVPEIAVTLGLTAGQVRARQHRMWRRLRALLAKYPAGDLWDG
jgi:RNA polymerase sigma factor (sigma-70 family)